MNVLIVEDEPHTAALLKEIIEKSGDFLVVEIIDSIVDSVDYLLKYQTKLDLLFFDIQLVDGESFEIFNHLDITIPIIFCTAYDDFALEAIKNNGINYILKPFKDDEIRRALLKYQSLVSHLKPNSPIKFVKEQNEYQQFFLSQFQDKTIIIRLSDVAYFYIENEITYLHTYDNKKHPIHKQMEHIQSVTNPKVFFRINRQMLISRNTIQSYEPYFNRKIVLNLSVKTEEKPVVSRLKVSEFKKWLEQ